MGCRVGISCDWEPFVDRRGSSEARYQLNEAYVRAVAAAGATALLLPHQEPCSIDSLLAGVDGLILSGGDCDVPPSCYGQLPREGLGRTVAARTAFELALLAYAWPRNLPVLGICGGMQVMNVARGGSLHQDLRELPGSLGHEQVAARNRPSHPVAIAAGSALAEALGACHLEVNSLHHQVVDRVGEGLVAVAHAPDGVVEAIEAADACFFLGVQWHPEALAGAAHQRLIDALIGACSRAEVLSAGTCGGAPALR